MQGVSQLQSTEEREVRDLVAVSGRDLSLSLLDAVVGGSDISLLSVVAKDAMNQYHSWLVSYRGLEGQKKRN